MRPVACLLATAQRMKSAVGWGSLRRRGARLDAAGPLPGYLRSDAQFMAYLIRSRDRLRTMRTSTWAVSGAGFALAIGGLAASLTLANPDKTILLASSAALAVLAALFAIIAIFSLRQEQRSQDK